VRWCCASSGLRMKNERPAIIFHIGLAASGL